MPVLSGTFVKELSRPTCYASATVSEARVHRSLSVWLGLEAEGVFPGVYCSNMGGECPCVCKAPSTLITRKRPLPSVLVQMGFQTSFLEEAFATFRTREGLLLSIVREQMDPQTSPCAEALVTLWTLEGLLPTVDPRVFSEPILLSVGLPTLLTHEGLLAPV